MARWRTGARKTRNANNRIIICDDCPCGRAFDITCAGLIWRFPEFLDATFNFGSQGLPFGCNCDDLNGTVELHLVSIGVFFPERVEVGYVSNFGPVSCGVGFATATLECCFSASFAPLDLDDVRVSVGVDNRINVASTRFQSVLPRPATASGVVSFFGETYSVAPRPGLVTCLDADDALVQL